MKAHRVRAFNPPQAKKALCLKIDDYIRDRIIIADQVIEETAVKKIKDGDVILTFARFVNLSSEAICSCERVYQIVSRAKGLVGCYGRRAAIFGDCR